MMSSVNSAFALFGIIYLLASVGAGILTNKKNMGFLSGIILSYMVTPVIVVAVTAGMKPLKDEGHIWQKW